jgi:hypothetical protein
VTGEKDGLGGVVEPSSLAGYVCRGPGPGNSTGGRSSDGIVSFSLLTGGCPVSACGEVAAGI